jgi:hypothetical protein
MTTNWMYDFKKLLRLGCDLVVEDLPSMCEALNSIFSTAKRKKIVSEMVSAVH